MKATKRGTKIESRWKEYVELEYQISIQYFEEKGGIEVRMSSNKSKIKIKISLTSLQMHTPRT